MVDQEHEESFAELFEQSQRKAPRRLSPGEKVTGTVTQVGKERVIVDLGDGLDGLAELAEFAERGSEPQVQTGDRVELYVARFEDGIVILAKSLGKGPGARLALEEAYRTGVPVEGLIVEVNKGGYVVEVASTRAFCPLGQMDVKRIDDPRTMIGLRLPFRVSELRGSRDVVLSHRALIEEELAERAARTRTQLEVGARFTGTVTNVRDFGAFVDIGGLEGLVPASEIAYGHQKPQDLVRAGQTVEVEVLRLEPPGPKDRSERIALSMRKLAADPWDALADLTEGDLVRGVVQRVQPFGAFVEIVPGVDGLIHVSAFGKRIGHPSEMVQPGDDVAVRIESVDRENQRVSLSFVPKEELESIVGDVGQEVPASEPAPAIEPGMAPQALPPPETEVVPVAPPKPVIQTKPGGLRVRRMHAAAARPSAPANAPAKAPDRTTEPPPAGVSAPAKRSPSRQPKILGRRPLETATPAAGARKPEEMAAPPVGSVLETTVDKIESFGLFVRWAAGRGLVPTNELDLPKGADLRKAFPLGSPLKAAVVEVRGDGKVRLSATAAAQAEERSEVRAWMETQKPASGKGFGTFADLFAKKK